MDYEKKYNEALEKARKYHAAAKSINDPSAARYENIFPELRESDDERIRKAIIKSIEEDSSVYEQEVSKEQMLVWLEKQKELMPPVNVDPCDASCDAYYQRGLNKGYELGLEAGRKEQKPNIELIQRSWYMEGYHDREFGKEPMWIIKTGEGGPKYEPNPKYGKNLSFRPSDEQMKGLKFFLDFHRSQRNAGTTNWQEYDAVESLYEQLKNL